MQCSLIQKLMLNKFKLAIEGTKNIYCVKSEGTVDHSIMVQEILLRLEESRQSAKVK